MDYDKRRTTPASNLDLDVPSLPVQTWNTDLYGLIRSIHHDPPCRVPLSTSQPFPTFFHLFSIFVCFFRHHWSSVISPSPWLKGASAFWRALNCPTSRLDSNFRMVSIGRFGGLGCTHDQVRQGVVLLCYRYSGRDGSATLFFLGLVSYIVWSNNTNPSPLVRAVICLSVGTRLGWSTTVNQLPV